MKLPKYIDIELNVSCNLKCKQCPYKEFHKKPTYMSIEFYMKIINQINWNASIKLCQRGEPLLSPIIYDAIQEADHRGLRTVINTNGLLLDKYAEGLIFCGLEALILSDYGTKKQLKNGKLFAKLNNDYPPLVDFIIKTERPEVWKDIECKIITPIYYDHLNKIEDGTSLPNWKCEQLFERLVIEPDGKVRCCCGHIHPQKYVGNVNTQPLKEIWNSSVLKIYRDLHKSGASHLLGMCRSCAVRKEIVKKK